MNLIPMAMSALSGSSAAGAAGAGAAGGATMGSMIKQGVQNEAQSQMQQGLKPGVSVGQQQQTGMGMPTLMDLITR